MQTATTTDMTCETYASTRTWTLTLCIAFRRGERRCWRLVVSLLRRAWAVGSDSNES